MYNIPYQAPQLSAASPQAPQLTAASPQAPQLTATSLQAPAGLASSPSIVLDIRPVHIANIEIYINTYYTFTLPLECQRIPQSSAIGMAEKYDFVGQRLDWKRHVHQKR